MKVVTIYRFLNDVYTYLILFDFVYVYTRVVVLLDPNIVRKILP